MVPSSESPSGRDGRLVNNFSFGTVEQQPSSGLVSASKLHPPTASPSSDGVSISPQFPSPPSRGGGVLSVRRRPASARRPFSVVVQVEVLASPSADVERPRLDPTSSTCPDLEQSTSPPPRLINPEQPPFDALPLVSLSPDEAAYSTFQSVLKGNGYLTESKTAAKDSMNTFPEPSASLSAYPTSSDSCSVQ
ncbi:unnamed protein product [Protopolystoma xenopodis]|uniref:Uncharacterized protein n=1 Tax=Protopolystoma xenopodis TaxID=117903 RepID=A0A3S5B0W3_9PLAT|nr:unnamed protein product [Protopolystoma xenopodis]